MTESTYLYQNTCFEASVFSRIYYHGSRSDNELALIDSAISNFDKVVVILNTMNPMELGPLESRNVSVLWVGAGGHKRLLTDVLRGEWGFTGHVITDACNTYNEDFNAKTSIDAGLDLYLTSLVGSFDIPGYASDASVMCDLRQACHRILYNIANSLAMNGISATSRVVFAMPPWGILLIIIDIVLVLGAAVGSFFMVRSIIAAAFKKRRGNFLRVCFSKIL